LILRSYLSPIAGPHMITAAHAIRGGAMIGSARPHLAQRIARKILSVERAVYATPECAILPSATRFRPSDGFAVCCPVTARSAPSRAAN